MVEDDEFLCFSGGLEAAFHVTSFGVKVDTFKDFGARGGQEGRGLDVGSFVREACAVGEAIQDGGVEDNEGTELQESDLLLKPDGLFFTVFVVDLHEVVG